MKIYPSKIRSKKKPGDTDLTRVQTITRTIALVLAFVSVFMFFVKILFF